jgi:hypothetical protein
LSAKTLFAQRIGGQARNEGKRAKKATPQTILASFGGKNSFFPHAVDPMDAFCIFVTSKQTGKKKIIL